MPTNTNRLYAENTGLSFQRSDDGGVNWLLKTSGITEPGGNFNFITSFTQDPSNPARLFLGLCVSWQYSNRGDSWTQAGSTFFGSRVGAIAVAPTNPDHVLMGTSNGGGPAWNYLPNPCLNYFHQCDAVAIFATT